MNAPLTHKEKLVLEFIEAYIQESGVSPSYQEIKDHFGFASFNSVQNYLKQLSNKGYISFASNQKRAISVLKTSTLIQNKLKKQVEIAKQKNEKIQTRSPQAELLPSPSSSGEILSLPLLGKVAAGSPIESYEHNEYVEVPPSMVRNSGKSYALKVQGDSMIDDGIFDKDLILVQKQNFANNGEIVVASIENEATVKRFYLRQHPEYNTKMVELRPSNERLTSMWFEPNQVQIQGVVVGLIRRFN